MKLFLAFAVAAFAQAALLKGTVKETADAGQYTYVLVDTGKGEEWAAIPRAKLKKGQSVAIAAQMVMNDFESKALGRRFAHVAFGELAGTRSGDPHAGLGLKPGKPAAPKAVAKAEGPDGRTVAEVNAQKKPLKGKTVAVRGTVVKFNGGILGSNWVHLNDGTGDIAVTTSGQAKLGDVVTAVGKLALDKDLGAGYFFPVLIENASLTR